MIKNGLVRGSHFSQTRALTLVPLTSCKVVIFCTLRVAVGDAINLGFLILIGISALKKQRPGGNSQLPKAKQVQCNEL